MKRLLIWVVACAVVGGIMTMVAHALNPFSRKSLSREMEITEQIRIQIPPRAGRLRLWVPQARPGPAQTASLVDVEAPWPYMITADTQFGNPFIFFEVDRPKAGEASLKVRYRVLRKEQTASKEKDRIPNDLFLRPRGLEIIDDTVARIVDRTTAGLSDPMERARELYLYVLSHVDYDKSGVGWGNGDVAYVCRVGKGNCTDFHSLFISLARSAGIPARFQIGYPVPDNKAAGKIEIPYHCWAEFFVSGKGWIPVDISKAWKNPARADYYFCNLDEHRVLVSTGRDIVLSPPQDGSPLNYLVRPYAEVDGRPLTSVQIERSFSDTNARNPDI